MLMKSLTEKKLILYNSLFIALLLNSYRLTALRGNSILASYWQFNTAELLFETAWNFSFCLFVALINLWLLTLPLTKFARWFILIVSNVIILLVCNHFGVFIQQKIFLDTTPNLQFRVGYFTRMLASHVLMLIIIQILLLLRKNRQKETENAQLRNAYLNAQLGLLKEQLNPHFFFNALGNLSAVVSENPEQAQQYISHLAKIFRYTLHTQKTNLVSLQEELSIFHSFAALQKLRLEDNICIDVEIPDTLLKAKLPYMSLQPLLENAVKHNQATREKALLVCVTADSGFIKVVNNLQPVLFREESTAIGLANLNERFKILMNKTIEIIKTDTHFTVLLPLLAHEN